MPAPITRPKRQRVEETIGCSDCSANRGERCTDLQGKPRDPHRSRVKAYEDLRPRGGNRGTAIRTVPVDLGADHAAYRALDEPDRKRVRDAGAVAMRALLRRG